LLGRQGRACDVTGGHDVAIDNLSFLNNPYKRKGKLLALTLNDSELVGLFSIRGVLTGSY
jgi:hypothetical protein